MMKNFLKLSSGFFPGMILVTLIFSFSCSRENNKTQTGHTFNDLYSGNHLNRIAFPIGGMGAGMFCLEGNGSISHFSVRNHPDVFNQPLAFAAVSVKGFENPAKILEGPVQPWKVFGNDRTGNGAGGTNFGLPRYEKADFLARFPFCTVRLSENDYPLAAEITGWSPFIPGDADNSSLPVGAIEYKLINKTNKKVEGMFSFNSMNLMKIEERGEWISYKPGDHIDSLEDGFIMVQDSVKGHNEYFGSFAVFTDDKNTVMDYCWFRGGWFDALTATWKQIEEVDPRQQPVQEGQCPGASIYLPFELDAKQEKTVKLLVAWYVPDSKIRIGAEKEGEKCCQPDSTGECSCFYQPWYSGKFRSIHEVSDYWRKNYSHLKEKSEKFRESFYDSTLPPEILEAVAANLTILKSPTVLRQTDGRLWAWEGCHDNSGCCYGSCTHVWNYAQAIPHLFPSLERTLRESEFLVSQDESGHQTFRTSLPIRIPDHNFHAAADGQLGGLLKFYREWRISGDHGWMINLLPKAKTSLDYCIATWDPKHKGVLEEPHHNTYDIEFWGPDAMCTSIYLGGLKAYIEMARFAEKETSGYEELFRKGKEYIENKLYNGEYFFQEIKTEGLVSPDPVKAAENQWNVDYSPEAVELLKKEGPKYQYGIGCLSDGVIGAWFAEMCGLEAIIDPQKVKNHLASVYKYNLKHDLSDHINPQRPGYAQNSDGGLLLCTWPKGNKLTLPFVYSNEVWTGIEYQVASHCMAAGLVKEGLDIVRTARKRYDGSTRNPFNEYECGHWYARAMASYGLIQGLTGLRYDAVTKTLFIDSRIGDFKSFFSTESGWGNVELKDGKPIVSVKSGEIPIHHLMLGGKPYNDEIH